MTRAIAEDSRRHISIADLNTEIDEEPRVHDIVLGDQLGFSRPRAIRQIIDRNTLELQAYGSLATRRGKSRGQEFVEYFLSEPQALLICMFSNTPRAASVRKMLIDVFMEYRRGKLEKPIQVREHDRRTSTKVEDAVRLKNNIDRLESVVTSIQPKQPNLCAMVIDGQPVWADLDNYDMGRGESAVVMKWDGTLAISMVDNFDGSHSLASARAGLLPSRPSPHGGKQRSVCLIIGKVVGHQNPSSQAVDQEASLEQIDHKPGRAIYKEKVLELIDRGMGNAEISRELGCCIETASRLRRQIKDRDDLPPFASPRFAPYRDRVITMIKQGYGNAEIARKLGCHLHTVERRRTMMNRQSKILS